jgi:hypothetical protein
MFGSRLARGTGAGLLLVVLSCFGNDRVAADDKDLPKDGPGEAAITFDMVSKDPAKYRGKRVIWPAVATVGWGKDVAVASNPEAKDARKHKLYAVRFDSEAQVGDLFLGGTGKITGTVAGSLTITYEVSGPGGAGKEKREEAVPLLVYPRFQPDKK